MLLPALFLLCSVPFDETRSVSWKGKADVLFKKCRVNCTWRFPRMRMTPEACIRGASFGHRAISV